GSEFTDEIIHVAAKLRLVHVIFGEHRFDDLLDRAQLADEMPDPRPHGVETEIGPGGEVEDHRLARQVPEDHVIRDPEVHRVLPPPWPCASCSSSAAYAATCRGRSNSSAAVLALSPSRAASSRSK